MNIAVTGANGHVGVNLCSALKAQGHYIRALYHKNNYGLKHIHVDTVQGDLLNTDSLQFFLEDIDYVIHLAAKISIKGDPDGSVRKTNVEGTRNILETARSKGIKKFIHFSSIHAFKQDPTDEVLDESRPLVGYEAFTYDKSKAEGEQIVLAAAMDGFHSLVICPTAIIGPADYEPSLTGKAILDLYYNKLPALVSGGYDWVDVRDVVNGCIASIEKGRKGEKYLLSGHWRSLSDISRLIMLVTGRRTTDLVLPFWVAYIGRPFIHLYSKCTGTDPVYTKESLKIIKHGSKRISSEKARNELDFNPRNLEETIKDLFIWFRNNDFIH